MFLRANAFHSGLQDGPEPFRGLYMGAFYGDALTDVAAHYWNGNIILQAPIRPCRSHCPGAVSFTAMRGKAIWRHWFRGGTNMTCTQWVSPITASMTPPTATRWRT